MRSINVSTPVFAAIWAQRQEGEETEDAILRRVLEVPTPKRDTAEHRVQSPSEATTGRDATDRREGGVSIPQYGAYFPEGFEIFRNYKGTDYRARATNGKWHLLNDNTYYASLHKLSTRVVSGPENSWANWKFKRSDGTVGLIDERRDQDKVSGRGARVTLDMI